MCFRVPFCCPWLGWSGSLLVVPIPFLASSLSFAEPLRSSYPWSDRCMARRYLGMVSCISYCPSPYAVFGLPTLPNTSIGCSRLEDSASPTYCNNRAYPSFRDGLPIQPPPCREASRVLWQSRFGERSRPRIVMSTSCKEQTRFSHFDADFVG